MQASYFRAKVVPGIFFISLFLIVSTDLEARGLKDKVKHSIENIADHLKEEVDKMQGSIESMQDYFDHYSWKGVVEERATSRLLTLGPVSLNGHARAVVVPAGQVIEGVVHCALDVDKCSHLSYYRAVLGIKGRGPQTTVYNHLGLNAKENDEKFTLKAPEEPGVYEIRFRADEHYQESDALKAWWDDEGREPDSSTTLGIIIVK